MARIGLWYVLILIIKILFKLYISKTRYVPKKLRARGGKRKRKTDHEKQKQKTEHGKQKRRKHGRRKNRKHP